MFLSVLNVLSALKQCKTNYLVEINIPVSVIVQNKADENEFAKKNTRGSGFSTFFNLGGYN